MVTYQSKKSVIGVVLAGGKSSRMGSNKALLQYKNKFFIDHAIELLKKLGASKIMISGNIVGYDCTPDLALHKGPLGGVFSIMEILDQSSTNVKLLFIPVDMPLLTVDLLNNLLIQLLDYDAACYKKHPLPFALSSNRRVQEALKKQYYSQLKGGSLRNFQASIQTNILEIIQPEEICFSNINTPEDLSQHLN